MEKLFELRKDKMINKNIWDTDSEDYIPSEELIDYIDDDDLR